MNPECNNRYGKRDSERKKTNVAEVKWINELKWIKMMRNS